PVLNVWPEAPDGHLDRMTVFGVSKRFRQLEQLKGLLERDRVHALMRSQARELRFFLVVLGAELHERTVLAVANGHRLTGRRVDAELARFGNVFARDGFVDEVDLLLELLPEALEHRNPFLFAVGNVVQVVFHLGGEAVVDIVLEITREKAIDDLAEVRRHETSIHELRVLLAEQGLNDRRIRGRAPDAILFQRFDEARFRIARRRLSEVLLGADGYQPQ